MSDSVVVNVISPQTTSITVNDTGESIYINPLTLNQGIINHSVTHQSGGSDELFHNLLGGLQGGSSGNYYHLTSGQYANLVTGAVIRPSDTGAFYPNSNPSGFITGVNLSGYVTGDVVRPSQTGNFITTSQTGAFYAASNPSGFITGVDLSAYVTGDVVRPSETGIFYLASNPSGFITGVDLSAYVTGSVVRPNETGYFIDFNTFTGDRGDITITGTSQNDLNFSIDNLAVTSGKIANSAVTTNKIADFSITTAKLASLAVTTNIIASNSVTNVKLADMAQNTIKGRISVGTSDPEDLSSSQVRTLINFDSSVSGLLSGYVTGSVVRPSETGAFYAASNPSGFITGVDLSFSGNYYTKNESESRYVNTTGAETIFGDKTFYDKVYINSLYVTGLETIVNTTNTNVSSNFILLNLTGGAVDGGIFFVTGSNLTGINDSGAIIGFDHSDKFKFGIGTRANDLSVLSTIASVEEVTGISGSLQTQISSLSNATGSYVLNSQTGVFYPTSNPSGFVTGSVVRPYETGSFITNSQTGVFYPTSNPSGFALTVSPARTTLTGDGATSIYAISGAGSLTNPSALIVATDGALQEPGVDYSVGGGYITFTSPLASGAKAVVVSPTNTIQVLDMIPSDGSVTSAKLASGLSISSPTISNGNFTYDNASSAAHRTSLDLDRYYLPHGISRQSSIIIYDFDSSLTSTTIGVTTAVPAGALVQITNAGGTHWNSRVKGWILVANGTAANAISELSLGGALFSNIASGVGAPVAGYDNYTLMYVFCIPNLTNVDIRMGLRIGNVARLVQIFQDNTASPGSSPVFNFFTNTGTYTTTSAATGAIAGAPTPAVGSYIAGTGTRYALVFDTAQRAGGTSTTVTLKIYSGGVTGDLTLAGTYSLANWNPTNQGSVPYVAVRNLNGVAAQSAPLHLDTVMLKSWASQSNILPAEILDILETV